MSIAKKHGKQQQQQQFVVREDFGFLENLKMHTAQWNIWYFDISMVYCIDYTGVNYI